MIPTHKAFRITPPVVLTEQEQFYFISNGFGMKPALTKVRAGSSMYFRSISC